MTSDHASGGRKSGGASGPRLRALLSHVARRGAGAGGLACLAAGDGPKPPLRPGSRTDTAAVHELRNPEVDAEGAALVVFEEVWARCVLPLLVREPLLGFPKEIIQVREYGGSAFPQFGLKHVCAS